MNPSDVGLVWKRMVAADLAIVEAIADAVHTQLPERADVMAEKFRLFPEGCRSLWRAGRMVGYGMAHPWLLHHIPPLDSFLVALPSGSDCLYLHDGVVLPEARGHNVAAVYVEEMVRVAAAHSLPMLCMVSVYGTVSLWARRGFAVADRPDLPSQLASYGGTARYMVRRISV